MNTDNPNRLYDSQNNNKGGYCWGPPMTYYEGSLLQIEFTVQHGCGAGHTNVDCDLILQYLCHPLVRDGLVTTTITQATMNDMDTDTVTGLQAYKYGMHEPYSHYQKCAARRRNKGLFTADQAMGSTTSARQTRQDNNENNNHGFECAEERDYYPYWHTSPWRDIAVLTSNKHRCAFFKQHSQNVEGRNECANPQFNNQVDCVANNSQWIYVQPWGIDAPECVENVFTRDNHLGNTKTGHTGSYSWTIPKLSTMGAEYKNPGGNTANCVFRLRYNISSSDYAGWGPVDSGVAMTDSSFNGEKSPVRQNPYVGYGVKDGYEWQLRLALNTDQYGRTFQDRSYMFYISQRPDGIAPEHRIINLNVRGKRGNIVEAYPAVEYDFTPGELYVNVGDYVHFQWTGCNTNPNYAGEGTQGTDRSNIVQLVDGRKNYPIDFNSQNLFDTPGKAWEMAHLNQYGGVVCKTTDQQSCCKTLTMLQNDGNRDQNPQNCAKINGPVQYFDGGPVRMTKTGTYYYMSTRNNNFTNRSQKGTITVDSLLPTWGIVMASAGAVGFVGASTLAGLTYYAQTHPQAAIANAFANCKL